MTAVTRFEDLIAWQEARKLMQLAYKITSGGSFSKDFEMRDQFRSAALSSMTNIAEGFDNESSAEFARFLGMARRSAVEVQSLCYAAAGCQTHQSGYFSSLLRSSEEDQSHYRRAEAKCLEKPAPPQQTIADLLDMGLDTWNVEL